MTEPIMVTRSSVPDFNEYINEIKDIWDTRWLTNMGSKHQRLQAALKEYLDVPCIELLSNGHMALEIAMQAMDLKGEVITTPFTFASTTQAIVRNGLTPVFCDIDPVDFTIDASKIEPLITDKSSAIVPVHVYGNICNVEEIDRIAKKHHLKVIYDAAHTFGETYKGRGVGAFGDASCFSFHATKVFNTIEGGAVCFSDECFGTKVKHLKNFGIAGSEIVDEIGANAKMNEFCAAMGLCNLKHVNDEISRRKAVVERYRSHLEGIEGIQLTPVQEKVKTNYAYFPVIFDPEVFGADRDAVFRKLAENDIAARKYFYPLTNTFDCYHGQYDASLTPVAFKISHRVLTLPLYAELPMDAVDRIASIVLSCRK